MALRTVLWFIYMIATVRVNWDVVNAKGSDCQLVDRRWVKNGNGLVAVLRDANCPGPLAQGTGYNVIFLHKAGEPNTKENIVFQYTPGFERNELAPYPTIAWNGTSRLEIHAPGVIERIVVQRDSLAGVHVQYKLDEVWPNATDGVVR